MRRANLAGVMVVLAAASPVWAQMKEVAHPYMLWTRDEAAAIKKRIDTDPAAQEQLARMRQRDARPAGKGSNSNPNLFNLFAYQVLGDEKAGQAELAALRQFIGTVPEPLTERFKTEIQRRLDAVGGDWDKIWTRGNASWADRHMRDEPTLQALRYDVLYDLLTPAERKGVAEALRAYVQFHLDGHKPWHADFKYSKVGWLPNMSWPRAIGTHIAAAALQDEKLIQAMFNSTGGFKWYFDEYVSDGRFYNEEFAKYPSNNYSLLLYCEAVHRLGLDSLGWGYTGKHGASMKSYIQMYWAIGYPRTEIPGGMANYRIVTMGDAKGSPFGMPGLGDHSLVSGYLPDGMGGDRMWSQAMMQGPLIKGQANIWYEMAHRRFPQEHFDYFLAQMRKPGEDVYLPTLYFGLGPIDPKKVTPPAVKSLVANYRQFAMLKAEESPAYWESPAPAVAVQFAGYYAHYAHDSFSLLGLQAFNRAIYVNSWGAAADHYVHPQIANCPPLGYCARHPWLDTVRGHCGVVVDNLQSLFIETGEEGLKNHIVRQEFAPAVKFVAARTSPTAAKKIYPDVVVERGLMLTREYLLDIYWASDLTGKKRRYEWMVHGAGVPQLDGAWKPTSELNGSMLYRPLEGPDAAQPAGYENKYDGNDLRDVRKLAADGAWSSSIVQDFVPVDAKAAAALPKRKGVAPAAATEVSQSRLGKAFYERQVGVRVSMLPEAGTSVFAGSPPGVRTELGGTTLMVRREAPTTVFAALHEPFEKNSPRPLVLTRIAQTPDALAAAVVGGGINDRVLLTYGAKTDAVTLSGAGESFTFASHGYVRIAAERVEVVGKVTQLKVKVSGAPKLVVNGTAQPAPIAGGWLTWGQ